ncbi:RNA polymerase sigma factor RpoD, partial [Burkholderia sp. PU8-34]
RIEDGLQDMIQAIAACPAVVSTILADADRIAAGELRIDELVDGISDDTDESEVTNEVTPDSDEVDEEADTSDDDTDDDDVEADAGASEKANAARLEELT